MAPLGRGESARRSGAARCSAWAIAVLTPCALSIVAACGGGSSGGGDDAPGVGGLQILATGGAGSGAEGVGGNGGNLALVALDGIEVLVLRQGARIDPVEPPAILPSRGANPLVVSADVTLRPESDRTLFGSVSSTEPATGLLVEPGVTLTLEPNADQGSGGLDTVTLSFAAGVVIDGAVRVTASEGNHGGTATPTAAFFLEASAIVIGSSGSIDTSGASSVASSTPGADAGSIALSPLGALINRGALLARGGDGTDGGGRGGQIAFEAENIGNLYNTGLIDASGGDGGEGAGGDGGDMEIECAFGAIALGGSILSRGGDGATQGGRGGPIGIEVEEGLGSVVATGLIDVSGGDATAEDGIGGDGGAFSFEDFRGPARVGGAIAARGGQGGPLGAGGSGGRFSFELEPQVAQGGIAFPSTSVLVSASIDVRGGSGGDGGRGGLVTVVSFGDSLETIALQKRTPIVFAGYERIELSGGDGVARGGSAQLGAMVVLASPALSLQPPTPVHIRCEADVIANGGAAPAGKGGGGGAVAITDSTLLALIGLGGGQLLGANTVAAQTTGASAAGSTGNAAALIELVGRFELRGGDGLEGGPGGILGVLANATLDSQSEVDVSGGAGSVNRGGAGGGVVLLTFGGAARQTGAVRADGGASGGSTGGTGGGIALIAGRAFLSGSVTARGGAGIVGGRAGFTGESFLDEAFGGDLSGGDFGGIGDIGGIAEGLPIDLLEELDYRISVVLMSTHGASEVQGVIDATGGPGEDADGPNAGIILDALILEPGDGIKRF